MMERHGIRCHVLIIRAVLRVLLCRSRSYCNCVANQSKNRSTRRTAPSVSNNKASTSTNPPAGPVDRQLIMIADVMKWYTKLQSLSPEGRPPSAAPHRSAGTQSRCHRRSTDCGSLRQRDKQRRRQSFLPLCGIQIMRHLQFITSSRFSSNRHPFCHESCEDSLSSSLLATQNAQYAY